MKCIQSLQLATQYHDRETENNHTDDNYKNWFYYKQFVIYKASTPGMQLLFVQVDRLPAGLIKPCTSTTMFHTVLEIKSIRGHAIHETNQG